MRTLVPVALLVLTHLLCVPLALAEAPGSTATLDETMTWLVAALSDEDATGYTLVHQGAERTEKIERELEFHHDPAEPCTLRATVRERQGRRDHGRADVAVDLSRADPERLRVEDATTASAPLAGAELTRSYEDASHLVTLVALDQPGWAADVELADGQRIATTWTELPVAADDAAEARALADGLRHAITLCQGP